MDIKITIGKRVTKIRNNMNMTKKDFAKLIGMKEQYLGSVESGQKGLTIEKAIMICNKTGVSADYLLLGVNNIIKEQIKKEFSYYTADQINTAFEIMNKTILFLK